MNISFRHTKCHCYGHIYRDYSKPFIKKVWRKKEDYGASGGEGENTVIGSKIKGANEGFPKEVAN